MHNMTTPHPHPLVFTCYSSDDWQRAKLKAKAGDWVIIASGTDRSRAGLCWIRRPGPTPTFEQPFRVQRPSNQRAWSRA